MQEKRVPQELEAEIGVIGSLFMDCNLILQVDLDVEDFYDQRHKLIFKAMKKLSDELGRFDPALVVSELEKNNTLVQAGGLEYILEIAEHGYSTDNLDAYVDLIQQSSYRRNVIKKLENLYQSGYDAKTPTDDYLNNVEQEIMGIYRSRKAEKFTDIKDVCSRVSEEINKKAKNQADIVGLDTGFTKLNYYTQGFQKGALIILAARPAMGKSAFAMNIAVQAAQLNRNDKGEPISVAVFSLEMSQEQIVQRMTASQASVNLSNIQKGNLTQKEALLVETATDDLANLNIYFCDNAVLTVADIRAKCRKQKMQSGLDLVVIDYLQLIGGSGRSSNRQEEVSNISRSLKQMARELGIPVIALAQLSRDVEKRDDKRPIMADLRESGSLEQDADIVMFLYREDYYKKGEDVKSNATELIIAKNRSGVTGTLNFIFQGEYQLFRKYVGN